MKTLWRRILLFTAMLVLAAAMHASADTRQYSAKTVLFPNNFGSGWSNQFTLSTTTNISVGITITNIDNVPASTLNSQLSYVFQNVHTGAKFDMAGQNLNSLSYTLTTNVPAGSYAFGVFYSGTAAINVYFKVAGTGGIKIPDKLEIVAGKDVVVSVTEENSITAAGVKSYTSTNEAVAKVTNINTSSAPTLMTVHGGEVGICTITVNGHDGSSDTMLVNVVSAKARPTLLYDNLTLASGETVVNQVINAQNKVKWTSSKPNVASVSSSGKIKALSYGKTTVRAKTKANGVTYDLACVVNVGRSDPMFIGRIVSYNTSNKKITLGIRNKSDEPMVVYSSGARLYTVTIQGMVPYRSMKLKSGKSVKIPSNKYKKITFTIKGDKLTSSMASSAARVKFVMDGRTYYAMIYPDQTLGRYILKQNLGTNNWLYSYPNG